MFKPKKKKQIKTPERIPCLCKNKSYDGIPCPDKDCKCKLHLVKRKLIHPDYGLRDQGAGRCPYCLASADMDCGCEKPIKKKLPCQHKWVGEVIKFCTRCGEGKVHPYWDAKEKPKWDGRRVDL